MTTTHRHNASVSSSGDEPEYAPRECSAANPDYGWYCPTCERAVQNEHVTYEETHDARSGGCGNSVEPNSVNHVTSGAGIKPTSQHAGEPAKGGGK